MIAVVDSVALAGTEETEVEVMILELRLLLLLLLFVLVVAVVLLLSLFILLLVVVFDWLTGCGLLYCNPISSLLSCCPFVYLNKTINVSYFNKKRGKRMIAGSRAEGWVAEKYAKKKHIKPQCLLLLLFLFHLFVH